MRFSALGIDESEKKSKAKEWWKEPEMTEKATW